MITTGYGKVKQRFFKESQP